MIPQQLAQPAPPRSLQRTRSAPARLQKPRSHGPTAPTPVPPARQLFVAPTSPSPSLQSPHDPTYLAIEALRDETECMALALLVVDLSWSRSDLVRQQVRNLAERLRHLTARLEKVLRNVSMTPLLASRIHMTVLDAHRALAKVAPSC